MKQLLIYGQGDFAKLMYHYFTNDSAIKVIGFCVDASFRASDIFCELPLVDFEDIQNIYPAHNYDIFIAIGYSKMRNRKMMFEKVKQKGYNCVNFISSKSCINKTLIMGQNNVIMQNVVIEPFVKIGNNNIIWSSSTICHDTTITSHSFISAQSLVGGFVEIKDNCFLGFNSTIVQNVHLEEETLLGSKSLLLNNTTKHSAYVGIPAKKKSTHEEEGIMIK